MINGVVVGIVIENQDPDKMHRVKVKFPVDAEGGVEVVCKGVVKGSVLDIDT
jgi:hypothetical protein